MSVALTQPEVTTQKAPSSNVQMVGWVKSDGTHVAANTDNPLPVTGSFTIGTGTPIAPDSDVVTVQSPTPTKYKSPAFEASKAAAKSGAGVLRSFAVFNSKTSQQYILIFDSLTVPGDGSVTPMFSIMPVPAGALVQFDFPTGLPFSTGLSFSNSTNATFTKALGSADCDFTVLFN